MKTSSLPASRCENRSPAPSRERSETKEHRMSASTSAFVSSIRPAAKLRRVPANSALPPTDRKALALAEKIEQVTLDGGRYLKDTAAREHAIQRAAPVPEALRVRPTDAPMLARAGVRVPASAEYYWAEARDLESAIGAMVPAMAARAREIVAALDEHQAKIRRLRMDDDLPHPDEALDAAMRPGERLRDRLADTPATTLDALVAKAVAACLTLDGTIDANAPYEALVESIMLDLLRLSGRISAGATLAPDFQPGAAAAQAAA
jgi:hypothetical protein